MQTVGPRHKLALRSICNIRNTDYAGGQPHFRLIKNPIKTKRYSSSLQQQSKSDSLKLDGWDDPSELPPTQCTNMLYNLSVKLQNYEVQQKKKDGEEVLDEIKENYKSIMEKTRLFARPTEVFSKYRQQINLYKETEHSEIIQTNKQLDLEYRPASNQIISARPKLQAVPSTRKTKQSQISVCSRDQQLLLEKHKSLKSIRECPKTSTLVARGKANKFERFKQLLAQHQKLMKIEINPKRNLPEEKKQPMKLKPRKFDLSLVQKKQRLNELQKRSNAIQDHPPSSEFQDTKLFRLR